MSSFYNKPTEENKKEAREQFQIGLDFYKKDRYIDAKACFEKSISLDYNLAEAYSKLGELYVKIGQIYKAKDILECALEIDHKIPDIYSNLGIIYANENKIKQAILFFEKALEIFPNDINTLKNLALSYDNLDNNKFIFYMEKASNLGDFDAKQYLTFKELENIYEKEKYNQVIDIFEQILDKKIPFFVKSLIIYSKALLKVRDYQKSLLKFYDALEMIEANPIKYNFNEVYVFMGINYSHLNQIKEANDFIMLSFQINPEECSRIIKKEKDDLVKINENGYPIIILQKENQKEIYLNAKADQSSRKSKSERILEINNITLNKNLPFLESEEDINTRNEQEIAERIVAIMSTILKAEGSEIEYWKFINKFKPQKYFTKTEKAFLALKKIDDNLKNQFILRYESLSILLWSLGYIDKIEFPRKKCDYNEIFRTIFDTSSTERLISESNLRKKSELLDQADLIYRIDWACRNKKIISDTSINDILPDVVSERHYAFNWLINFDYVQEKT